MKNKILNVKVSNQGKLLTIELNREDSFKFIFLNADQLPDIAEIMEHYD